MKNKYMKYNILFAFILLATAASAQLDSLNGAKRYYSLAALSDTFPITTSLMPGYLSYYQDTASVVFLVTECDTCPAKALPGYAVYVWKPWGTPQPDMFGIDKKPLPKNVVVWDMRKREEE
jgi:hypothetical protein